MQDALFEIAIRLDDDTLLKVSTVLFWREQIREILSRSSHDFWYRRVKRLTGTDLPDTNLDWKKVYYSVVAREKPDREIDAKLEFGLDSLEMFRTFERIYGTGLISTMQEASWSWQILDHVDDPELLEYLSQSSSTLISDHSVGSALHTMTSNSVQRMIDPLLSLLSTPELRREEEAEVLIYAGNRNGGRGQTEIVMSMLERVTDQKKIDDVLYIQSRYLGNEETIRLILARVSDPEAVQSAMRQAVRGDNLTALRMMMERVKPDINTKQDLFRLAYESKSEDAMLHLIEDDRRVVYSVDPMLLTSRTFLELSARSGHSKILKMLLERVDPTIETLSLIFSDPRVDIEKFDTETLNLALLGRRGDAYSKLLRYITLKRPTGLGLVDWMIAQRDRAFVIAARDILRGSTKPDPDVTPIWCLLSILLYPTLTLREVDERMRAFGIGQELITRSAQLVGLMIGASRSES